MRQAVHWNQTEVCMHSMTLWPVLSLLAAMMVFVPTLENSGHRSMMYWLILPTLLAGILAAWSHFAVL